MAAGDFTVGAGAFVPGTVLGAYPTDQLTIRDGAPKVPPTGSPTAQATVASNGTAAFTGLNTAKRYLITPKEQSAVQSVKVNATAGQFRLRYGSDTTPDLAFNISAANLQTALRALPGIGSTGVTVSGGPGDSGGTTPYVVTFAGTLANQGVSTLEVIAGSTPLSGGGATASVTVTTAGHAGGESYVLARPNAS